MFQIDATAIDTRVKGVSHVLNVIAVNHAAIAGVTLDADAKPLRNYFLCHCSGVLMLGFRFGLSFPTPTRISHRLQKCNP
ncbi:hypothetical protein D3C72_1827140 [compost metagenome]